MTKNAIISANIPQTYAELRRAVEDALHHGQQRVEQAKLRTYWETGWLIKEHLLFNAARAEYGAQVVPRLARDLKANERTLYECLKFARVFPILSGRSEFTWAYYRKFIQIADPVRRKALMTEASEKGWTSDDVAERVAQLNAAIDAPPSGADEPNQLAAVAASQLLKPRRGTPGLHLIVEKTIGLSVDLGFRHYWPLTPEQAKRFAKSDIVRIASDDSLRAVTEAKKADLFAYAATLVRVVDGDTLVVALEISPGEFLEQKLRLRGLDAPEMSTPEGKAAKRFVDTLVAKTTSIVIRTTKPDKYDRYLADVFLIGDFSQLLAAPKRSEGGSTLDSQPAAEGGLFLNNALLENGHAVRKDASDFGDDWGFK